MSTSTKNKLQYKVSPKGGLSVYGLQRFPVTLYAEQWAVLIDDLENLKKALEENKPQLKVKSW